MKTKLYRVCYWALRLWLCVCFVMAVAPRSSAQFLGYTSPQTDNEIVFTNQTTSATFLLHNIGQSIHYVSYASTTQPCAMNIRLAASYTGAAGTWFPISEDGADPVAFPVGIPATPGAFPGLVASGSFPQMRVELVIPTNVSGNNCTMNVNYSGTSTTNGTIQQGFIQSSAFRKLVALALPATNSLETQVPAPFGSTFGRLYVLCNSGCGGLADLIVRPVGIPLASQTISVGAPVATFTLANNTTIQTFDVPAVPAESVEIDGASQSGWITVYYVFNNAGNATISGTVNVNCLSGCGGGGGGGGIVFGPDAPGVSPTQDPVQTSGLNPAGEVERIQTDTTGHTITVGQAPIGVTDPGTNPQIIGGNDDITTLMQEASTDKNLNNVTSINVNVANTVTDPANGVPTIFTTTPDLPGPLVAQSISTSPADQINYGNGGLAANIFVAVTGTWTGSLVPLADPIVIPTPTFNPVTLYPVLGTGANITLGAAITAITADGYYVILNGGTIETLRFNGPTLSGTAAISIGGINPAIATLAVQPTAANLNATVTGTVGVTGPVTVVQPTAASLNATVVQSNPVALTATVLPFAATTGTLGLNIPSECTSAIFGSSTNGSANAMGFNITGTWTGVLTVNGSLDGVSGTFQPVSVYPILSTAGDGLSPGIAQSTIIANGNYMIYPAANRQVQVCANGALTGTATINVSMTSAANATYAMQPIASNLHAQVEPGAGKVNQCTVTPISFSASGNNTIIAGVSSETVRVYELYVVFNGAANVTLQNGPSTAFTGPMGINSGGSVNLTQTGGPHLVTSSGNGFVINSSAAVQASGWVCTTQS